MNAHLTGPGDDDETGIDPTEPQDEAGPSWVAEDNDEDTGTFSVVGGAAASWVEEAAPAEGAEVEAPAPEPSPAPKPAPRPSGPAERGKMKVSALDDLFSRAKNLKKDPKKKP